MPSLRKSLPLILALALVASAQTVQTAQAETRASGVGGHVLAETSPLAAAQIYAYQLADLSLHKVMTDRQGNFLFQDLPAGLYKIIAHKAGFMPVVVMLTRTTAQAYTFLELKLSPRQQGTEKDAEDFWTIRAKVPADVLRDMETAARAGNAGNPENLQIASYFGTSAGSLAGNFKTEMQALTGVDRGSQLSGGGVGIKGQLGGTQVDLKGNFRQLSSDSLQPAGSTAGTEQTSSLSLNLGGHGSRINISSISNRGNGNRDDGPVDFEHYQVNWSQEVGENGHSDFAAHYTSESNFHRQGAIDPLDIPQASRSYLFEGAYTEEFNDSHTLQAGLRYRERQFGLGDDPSRQGGKASERQALSSIDLFSRGGVRVQPAVLMEYGLYSTLSNGSLALTPQGGLVLQLGSDWQLETTAARRVYKDSQAYPDFLPTLFEQRDLCEQGSEACYQVNLTRKGAGDDNEFTFGAAHRQVGDTLRLYFSDDFFDRLESLYLVRGDSLPEVHVGMRHKLSPRVTTKFDSSIASGGGGAFFGADGRPYENQVRYLVASLDTQFLASSTGVFVAFHQLQQQLDPTGESAGRPAAQMEYERLQLMVNQNLNFLLSLASDWTVQLNMELSRGDSLTTDHSDSDRIRRRILGGIAVKF
jgi:hypothetical protein